MTRRPGDGRGAKEGINGRAMQVLPGSLQDAEMAIVDQQMDVGRRDVDVPFTEALTVHGMADG
jgi:hypothetical protein